MKIAFVRSTNVKFEPVILKKARVAANSGLRPIVLYWDRVGDEEMTRVDGVDLIPIFFGKAGYGRGVWGLGARIKFATKVLLQLKVHRCSIVHACDLDTALPVTFLKIFSREKYKIVYDIFDSIQDFSSPIPKFLRLIVDKIDTWVQQRSDCIIVPDENRLNKVISSCHQKVTVIFNSPDLEFCPFFPRRDTGPIKLVYIGGLSLDRGIDFLIDAAIKLGDSVEIVVGGQGVLSGKVEAISKRMDNLSYIGQVEYSRVIEETAKADLIYAVYSPEYAVNRVASPNKFFEAVSLGRPIMVAKNTSIDSKVMQIGNGLIVPYTSDAVVDALAQTNKPELHAMGLRSSEAYEIYGWERQAQLLKRVYADLGSEGS